MSLYADRNIVAIGSGTRGIDNKGHYMYISKIITYLCIYIYGYYVNLLLVNHKNPRATIIIAYKF